VPRMTNGDEVRDANAHAEPLLRSVSWRGYHRVRNHATGRVTV
jgi:hypothetical protein